MQCHLKKGYWDYGILQKKQVTYGHRAHLFPCNCIFCTSCLCYRHDRQSAKPDLCPWERIKRHQPGYPHPEWEDIWYWDAGWDPQQWYRQNTGWSWESAEKRRSAVWRYEKPYQIYVWARKCYNAWDAFLSRKYVRFSKQSWFYWKFK